MARGYGRNYIQNNALLFGKLDWIINFAWSVQLHIVSAQALLPGWTGKLWAIELGIQAVET